MRLPTRDPDTPEINLTPLIDVVFLMLVFFVLTTTFTADRALQVTLPAADSAAAIDPAPVVVRIPLDGPTEVAGMAVPGTGEGLRRALLAALAGQPEGAGRLLVRADRRVPHGRVTRIMDQAGQLGFSAVSIATTTETRAP